MSRYITTTLPYVNADPHIGFALEVVQADALARYWRLMGEEVFFNTGTDEHGQKIYQKAQEAGQDTQAYVDHYAAQFRTLKDTLHLSNDRFIRTTDAHHIRAAQSLWQRAHEKGDIYKKTYEGLYCVGCEAFLTEKDIVDGACPNHPGKQLETIKEENYFFALSKYEKDLEKYLSTSGVIVPEHHRLEALQFVQDGLEDFSISREKTRMPWGVPVPDDDAQVMYVWFDALTNYISTLGWPCNTIKNDHEAGCTFKTFWEDGKTLQTAGKDQVRFQSIMWQAMLMSADVPTTNQVFYHGFITSAGQKMSKSIGNVIEPKALVEKYGTEAARYMLLRHVHPTEDTDITFERMDEWYTADLVNGIGNLTSRILAMTEKANIDIEKAESEIDNLYDPIGGTTVILQTNFETGAGGEEFVLQVRPHYISGPNEERQNAVHYFWTPHMNQGFNFQAVLVGITANIKYMDVFITKTEVYRKTSLNREENLMRLLLHLKNVAYAIIPCLPETSSKILQAIQKNKKPENLFGRLV